MKKILNALKTYLWITLLKWARSNNFVSFVKKSSKYLFKSFNMIKKIFSKMTSWVFVSFLHKEKGGMILLVMSCKYETGYWSTSQETESQTFFSLRLRFKCKFWIQNEFCAILKGWDTFWGSKNNFFIGERKLPLEALSCSNRNFLCPLILQNIGFVFKIFYGSTFLQE